MPADHRPSVLVVAWSVRGVGAIGSVVGSRRLRGWLCSGWLAALVTAGCGVAVLRYYDAPVSDLFAFALYQILAVTGLFDLVRARRHAVSA
jgi:hypothetical protein